MNVVMKLISLVALGATIVPGMLCFAGLVSIETVKIMALIGTIAWFIATPFWMSRELPVDATEVEI